MTHAEIIYDLRELLLNGKLADDSSLEDENIAFWVKNTRALLVKQYLNKGYSIDFNLIQDLKCQLLEVVDRAECCDLEVGCSILRTVNTIPPFIETYHGLAITRVGPIDKLQRPYSLVNERQAVFSGNGRYNKTQKFAFWKGSKMYLKVADCDIESHGLRYMNIQGVLEDPELAYNLTVCDGSPCYNMNMDYPMPAWMVETMKEIIVKNNYKLMYLTPTDNANDASSQPMGQGGVK